MKLIRNTRAACAVLLTSLVCACSQPRLASLAQLGQAQQHAGQTPVSQRAAAGGQRAVFASIDAYKDDVAALIMRYNSAHTFSGKLPPMLPAVVVLRITVDREGRMTDVSVQRSRNEEASKVALASMQRTGQLPRPFNLATGPGRSLTFSETFLFNADYRFQLRTLAPIQTAD
ncbi:MAG: energy transducer TonB [Pseudomonadota bacterium]